MNQNEAKKEEVNSEELIKEVSQKQEHAIDRDVFNHVKSYHKKRLKAMSKSQLIDTLIVMSIQQTELKEALKQLLEEKQKSENKKESENE